MSLPGRILTKADSPRSDFLYEAAIVLAAVIGRLPALGAWWTLDDWGQLARAAGVLDKAAGLPARLLSQHLWWDLAWPLWGLAPQPQALVRIGLHAFAAWMTARIGRRAGLSRGAWFLAGLLFAASPLAFTPLYWASGIQELLAACFALLAVDRWLAGTRRDLAVAVLAAVLSVLAKESGFGLPVFFLAVLWWGRSIAPGDRALAWTLILLTGLVVLGEGLLVMDHFATGPDDPYALGGPAVMLGNLGTFGWWLLSPGPLLASGITWAMTAAGWAFFLLWILWAGFRMPLGRPLPAAALLAAMLVLAPALPLRSQLHPYLAYLAAAPLALALATLVPRGRLGGRWALVLALPALLWALAGMKVRLESRNELGFPADPVVRATSLSWSAAGTMRAVVDQTRRTGADSLVTIVLYQPPAGQTAAEDASRFGADWVDESELFLACGGRWGPALMAPPGTRVTWKSALTDSPAAAQVLAASATGFKIWGPLRNALFYAAVTDVALGHFERARRHLVAAAAVNPEVAGFVFDEGQMIVPVQLAEKNLQPFIDWTVRRLDHGSSAREIGGVQDLFFQVMSACTGKTVAELTAGSHLLAPSAATPDTTGRRPQ